MADSDNMLNNARALGFEPAELRQAFFGLQRDVVWQLERDYGSLL